MRRCETRSQRTAGVCPWPGRAPAQRKAGPAAQRRRSGRLFRQKLARLREEGGAVAIMVAITLPVLVLMSGGAVDYAQSLAARTKLQTTVDAAMMATARHKASHPDLPEPVLRQYFRKLLKGQLSRRAKDLLKLKDIEFSLSTDQKLLSATVTASIDTHFLRLAGFDHFDIKASSKAKSTFSRTEVALVLDVSTSMKGARLKELKEAVKDFLNAVDENIPNNPEAFKVSIVPFAQYVNVGKENRNASWIDVPPDGERSTCNFRVCNRWQKGGEVCRWEGTPDGRHRRVCEWDDNASICIGWRQWTCADNRFIYRDIHWEGCVGSRDYPLNIRDDSYALYPVPGVMNYNRNTANDEMDFYGYAWSRNYCPSASILPLTSLKEGKAQIIGKIDSLDVTEWTYIPAGLVWGWRVLSHKEPFSQGADAQTAKRNNVRKIIVLMTDGENSRAPSINLKNSAYKDHSSGNRRYANRLTRELCNNIKSINPETGKPYADIITITFNIDSPRAKQLMKECASLGSYDVKSGQLKELFLTLAQEMVKLQLAE